MSNVREKITEFFERLTSTEKLMMLISLLVVLIIFYIAFISNNYRTTDIDYSDLDASTIIDTSYIVYDRDEVLSIDEIMTKVLKVYTGDYILGENVISVNGLYSDVVSSNYKKKVSRKEFSSLIENVYVRVLGENGSYDSSNTYIQTVYYSADYDMYIVQLKTLDESSAAYVGIKIDDGEFYITYVE